MGRIASRFARVESRRLARDAVAGLMSGLAVKNCWTLAEHAGHDSPDGLRELVRVAGRRWTVEESFQASKTLTGLDQHQVRRWTSWHRWTILAMLAYALFAVLAATERAETPTPQGLIALTCNEIHHLFNTLLIEPIQDLRHRLHWSTWRRRHQHRARTSHYQRRQAIPTRDHELRLSY